MNRPLFFVIVGVLATAVLASAIFLAMRAPTPSHDEWTIILAADRIAGTSSALSEVCPFNRGPLVELLHARLSELRLNESEKDQFAQAFAAGISDAFPASASPKPKEICDTLARAQAGAIEAIGKTLSDTDLEKAVKHIKDQT